MNTFGSWIRYLAFQNFSIALLGQTIMGLSYCIILEAPICKPNQIILSLLFWFSDCPKMVSFQRKIFCCHIAMFSKFFRFWIGLLVSCNPSKKWWSNISIIFNISLFFIEQDGTLPLDRGNFVHNPNLIYPFHSK